VSVRDAFLYCGKARSWLWHEDYYVVSRDRLPSYGQMPKEQIDTPQTAPAIEASVEEGYRTRLY
jgi:hypothetical protein